MSDVEEPPSKVSKYQYEMSQIYSQSDELDEGQEEWLSEDMLTDDDGNQLTDVEHSDSALGTASTSHDTNIKVEDSNIEQTLNSLENQEQQDDLPNSLDEFLVRKTKSPMQQAPRAKEESDGNDTDDLLRMLGDDDKVKKKTKKIERKSAAPTASSDEDDNNYKRTSTSKLKMAKSEQLKLESANRATPEEGSTTDASGDEVAAAKPVALQVKKRQGNYAAKSTSKPHVRKTNMQILKLPDSISVKKHKVPATTQHPTIPKSGSPVQLACKPQTAKYSTPPSKKTKQAVKNDRVTRSVKPPANNETKKPMKRPEPEPEPESDNEESIDEDEYAEEDDIDLDEDFALSEEGVEEGPGNKQPMMYPEQLDEDMMSDFDSNTDNSSIYGEFPSSDSDDLDDWFGLDLREERAGDYLPLLGDKAYELLLEEKKSATRKLTALKQNLHILTEESKRQAEKLRVATATLAEIEDVLKIS